MSAMGVPASPVPSVPSVPSAPSALSVPPSAPPGFALSLQAGGRRARAGAVVRAMGLRDLALWVWRPRTRPKLGGALGSTPACEGGAARPAG